MGMREQLMQETAGIGVTLNDRQIEQFEQYFAILTEWNQVMNLTAITEEKEVVTKHFTDSLALVKAMPKEELEAGRTLIDVGTGAGFPGIPLKIAFPNLKVTLLDSLNKRVKFLNTVCEELGLEGVEAVHGRAEDFGQNPKYREQYDLCVSRAVANMASLSEYCVPFVKVGGYFIPYKSGDVEEELKKAEKAIKLLGGTLCGVSKFSLPGGDGERSLIKIRKEKTTGKRYPRKAGLPAKEPLV